MTILASAVDPANAIAYDYVPAFLQVLVAIAFAGGSLAASLVLGKSGRRTAAKDMAYECGKDAQGASQPRFSVKFYLVAMLFILFDIEVVFLYSWAVIYQEMIATSWLILLAMIPFVILFFVGDIYAWRKGALDWK